MNSMSFSQSDFENKGKGALKLIFLAYLSEFIVNHLF